MQVDCQPIWQWCSQWCLESCWYLIHWAASLDWGGKRGEARQVTVMIFSSMDMKVFPPSLSVIIMSRFLNKTLKRLLRTMMQLSAQPLTLFSSLHVPLSIRLSCLLFFCSFSKPPPPATFILQICHFCVSSTSFISFASFMSFFCLFPFVPQSNCQVLLSLSSIFHFSFHPHLPLPSVFYIDFHSLHVSLSLSGPFIALINFSAYEMMLLPSSSNFLTLSLFPPVPVPPAGGRGGSVLDGKKNEEEG